MQVNTANSQSSGTPSASKTTGTGSSLDYDAFLKLFMAEMKNQDPTAPTSSTEYIAQFATFSQVEQSMQTNTKLDSLLTSGALAQADNLIGRTASFVATDGTSVSSKITSIRIVSGGAVANLENGNSVALDAGVTIS